MRTSPEQRSPKRSWWYLSLLTGVGLISTSAVLVTIAQVAPTISAFYRNFFAAILWLPILLLCRPAALRFPTFSGVRTQASPTSAVAMVGGRFRLPGPAMLVSLLGLTFACDLWAWHRAILRLGAGPATLVGNLQVLFVSLLAVFLFGERLQKGYWLGCLLALTGIGMLTLGGGLGHEVEAGVVYGLLTAFSYSLFLIVLKLLGQYETTAEQTLFWIACLSALVLAVMAVAEGRSLLLPAGPAVGWLLLHAFLSSVAGWWLIVRAMQHLPVSVTSTLLLLQPVLTSVWGWIFLGQRLSGVQVAGIVIAVVGIRLANQAPLLGRPSPSPGA